MNENYTTELKDFCKKNNISFLTNSSIMVTGASGLIGSYLIDILSYYNTYFEANIKMYALVRDLEKAQNRFNHIIHKGLKIIKQDVSKDFKVNFNVDYIIHAASNATPHLFDKDPIGTIDANVLGTKNLLEFSRENKVKRFLYISSSEVYGNPIDNNTVFSENDMGVVNPLNPRSSYTESKRMAENITVNYMKQYQVPINIARIGFAYGPTFTDTDDRLIPQLIREAMNNKSITLKSTGSLIRSYIYIYDVASAIFSIIEKGIKGETYNVSNKKSNVSVKEIAKQISSNFSIEITYDLPEKLKDQAYAPFKQGLINATKLEILGWKAVYNISDGIKSTIKALS